MYISLQLFFEAFTALGQTEESPLQSYIGRLDGEAVAASSLSSGATNERGAGRPGR